MRDLSSARKLVMVLGPTEIEDDVLALGAMPQQYNRTQEFSLFLGRVFKNLQYLFQTEMPVYVLSSSGTGAMECAITNLLSRGEQALYVNGGTFGKRWGDLCHKHNVIAEEIVLPIGTSVSCHEIERRLIANKNIKVVFTTLNETSTGVLTDVRSVAAVTKKYGVLLVVDAVSALGVEEVKMDEWGIDVLLTSSQKALSLPPGLGFIAFSEAAMRAAEKSNLRIFYFDIFEYFADWKRNQTPFTPPISLLYQLDARLEKITQETLQKFQERYLQLTMRLRTGLRSLGLHVAGNPLANCVTGVLAPEGVDASEVVRVMNEKFHISIAPSPGDLKTRLFRIGNFGNISESDIDYCLASLKETLIILEKEKNL